MNLSPLLSGYTVIYSNLTNFCQLTGRLLGHIWKVISQMPHHLYQLVLSIKALAEICFSFNSHSANQISVEEIHTPNSKPASPRRQRLNKQEDLLNSLDYHLHGIDKNPVRLKDHLKKSKEELEKPKGNITPFPNVDHDPLDKMRAVSQLDPMTNSATSLSPSVFIQQDIENEILLFIQGMIEPAQALLSKIEDKKGAHWQVILELLEKLEQELDPLKGYASKFEKIPKGHCLVQDTMKALEDKARTLGKELCAQIKRQYRVNYSIKKDGHCLFWSIENLLSKNETPVYYRKLAADYIRKHQQNFVSGVTDAAKTKQGRAKINEYVKSQGGRQAWFDKLEKKLGKRPTNVDLYCDCLENSNLWGGVIEVIALSEQLKVPILIFTRQDNKTWRFDMKKRVVMFKDKDPLLLYYNGINHYQNLIPIRKQAKIN